MSSEDRENIWNGVGRGWFVGIGKINLPSSAVGHRHCLNIILYLSLSRLSLGLVSKFDPLSIRPFEGTCQFKPSLCILSFQVALVLDDVVQLIINKKEIHHFNPIAFVLM